MDASGCFFGAAPRGHPPEGRHGGVRQGVAFDERVAGRQGVVDDDGAGPGHGGVDAALGEHAGVDDPRRAHDTAGAAREEDVPHVHAGREGLPPAVGGGQQQQVRSSGRDRHSVLSCYFYVFSCRVWISVDECQHLEQKTKRFLSFIYFD